MYKYNQSIMGCCAEIRIQGGGKFICVFATSLWSPHEIGVVISELLFVHEIKDPLAILGNLNSKCVFQLNYSRESNRADVSYVYEVDCDEDTFKQTKVKIPTTNKRSREHDQNVYTSAKVVKR
jgi:hypothetical protein